MLTLQSFVNVFLDSTDRPQAELVPPPIYAEVQRHLNGRFITLLRLKLLLLPTETALALSVSVD